MPVAEEARPTGDLSAERIVRRRRAGLLAGARGRTVGLLCCLVVLTALVLLSIAVGTKPIPLPTVLDALFHHDPANSDHIIVRSLRVPRTAAGLLVGTALGLAGALMQGVARNPLADPGILGVEAGASLCVVIALHFHIGAALGLVWFAFAGAAVTAVVVYALGALGREGATPVKLALAGAAVTALLGSITSAILLLDVTSLDQFRFWAVGSLAGRDPHLIEQLAPFIVAGAALALICGRRLNALALGDDVARALGQRVGLARGLCALAVVVLVGAATAIAGPIGFVGLTVPHVARAITGPDYRWVLPYSAVLAPILLLSSDIVGRVIARPGEIQVGIITALIGAPVFVALVRRRTPAEI